jgi:hypothetical protein
MMMMMMMIVKSMGRDYVSELRPPTGLAVHLPGYKSYAYGDTR